jgi:hypothetical protein
VWRKGVPACLAANREGEEIFARLLSREAGTWGGKRLSLRQQRGKARKNYSFLIEKILRAPLKEK